MQRSQVAHRASVSQSNDIKDIIFPSESCTYKPSQANHTHAAGSFRSPVADVQTAECVATDPKESCHGNTDPLVFCCHVASKQVASLVNSACVKQSALIHWIKSILKLLIFRPQGADQAMPRRLALASCKSLAMLTLMYSSF